MERFLLIDNEKIPVSEEVYQAYKRPLWRERKRRQTRAEKERSLEGFIDAGFELPSGDKLVDEIVADKLLLELLLQALAELTDEERALVDALYYAELSVREVAAQTGKSKSAVQRAKDRVLKKLQNFLT